MIRVASPSVIIQSNNVKINKHLDNNVIRFIDKQDQIQVTVDYKY